MTNGIGKHPKSQKTPKTKSKETVKEPSKTSSQQKTR